MILKSIDSNEHFNSGIDDSSFAVSPLLQTSFVYDIQISRITDEAEAFANDLSSLLAMVNDGEPMIGSLNEWGELSGTQGLEQVVATLLGREMEETAANANELRVIGKSLG